MFDCSAIGRRTLVKAGAAGLGALATVGLTPSVGLAAPAKGGNGRLVPTDKLGTITFTQRDAVSRPGTATGRGLVGKLGGPGYPQDPTDLGPDVPLPGGWVEVLAYLGSVGFRQIEFAGLGQGNAAVGNVGGVLPSLGSVTSETNRALLYANKDAYLAYVRQLRGWLDQSGLAAIGNHGYIPLTWAGPGSAPLNGSAAGTMNQWEYDRFQVELEAANILGMPFTGTGSDPTNANNRNKEAWDLAAEKWDALNVLGRAAGVGVYPHNHSPAYQFLQDGPMVQVTVDRNTGATLPAPVLVRGESGTRLMEHYLAATNPALSSIELDVFWAHVAQHQHRYYFDWTGARKEKVFDITGFVAANTHRIPLYHAKDGLRNPAAPQNQGYDIVPFGTGSIDYKSFYQKQGAKGSHNSNYEQDTAPGNALTDPGQSLRVSKLSVYNLSSLRG